MTKKKLLILLGSVVLALVMVVMACAAPAPTAPTPTTPTPPPTPAPAPEEEVITLRFASWSPRGTFYFDDVYQEMATNIEIMSGGRIKVEVYGAGEAAPAGEVFEAVRTGVLDFGTPWPAYYKGIVPEVELEVAVVGGLHNINEDNILFWKKGWADILRNEVYAPLGLYYLGHSPNFGGFRLVSRSPVTSLDDIIGMKIRATPPFSTLFSELGAKVVYIPYGEIYTAMATGTADGAAFGALHDIEDLKMYEVAPYVMDPALSGYSNANYLVNMDVWNSLPEDLQHILQVAAWANATYGNMVGQEKSLEAWAKMEAGGAEMTYLDSDDVATLTATGMEILDDLGAKSDTMGKMVKIYKDFMTELGYL